MAEMVDGELRARMRIVNQWVGTIPIKPGCVNAVHLYDLGGQPVPGWDPHWCHPLATDLFLRAGRVLVVASEHAMRIETSRLEPGIYAVVFRFWEGLRIGGRLANIPDMVVLAVIE
jgi:hypothetical protein